MKFIYISEGAALMIIVYVPFLRVQSHWQVPLILIIAISLFRLPYGVFRTSRDLKIPTSLLIKTFAQIVGVAALLVGIAWTLRTLTTSFPPVPQMVITGAVYTAFGIFAVYFISLPEEARERIRTIPKALFRRQAIDSKPPNKDPRIGRR